ncbi:MAG TPA: hypothetical protein DCO75_05030 [Fibrobacteres bacterium]|jgi:hypothetical protein|nr:hypothetical protein [Fibrobacterota bacterium]
MTQQSTNADWTAKGATLSHQSAMKEFGLTEKEIFDAVNQGMLQFRENNIYGNPFLRLLRKEVEKYVEQKKGTDFLRTEKLRNELKSVEKELRKLKSQMQACEKRKEELTEKISKTMSAKPVTPFQ